MQIITSFNPARKARRNGQGRVCRPCFSRLRILSPTKRIPRTFHGARHAPWHHRGPLMPSPIKAKCSGKKKRSEKEAWGWTGKERRTKRSRERSSASVAGKNSGRCYSWCELSRGGFIMQQRTLPVVSSTLRLCLPGTDLPDLPEDGRKNQS